MSGHSVAVCVCTRRRPKMLRACLDSLIVQVPPESWAITLIVVENDDSPHCVDIIAAVKEKSPYSIKFLNEMDIGIPLARNRAIETAQALGVEWIAFIDDDEVAEADWLARLCGRAEQHGVDVVQGPSVYKYPSGTPDWLPRRSLPRRENGQILRTASTNNVMFRRALIEEAGLGLRFDLRFRFTGGSDVDFFNRATERGVRIVWEQSAIVSQSVPQSRLSLGWQLKRAFRVGANKSEFGLRQRGLLWSLMKQTPKNVFRLTKGVVLLPLVVLWPFGSPFRRVAFLGMKNCASAFGGFSGFTPFRMEPYRSIDGE